ncbi:trypsin-like peptidase domain-containing protein [Chitinophagaceae bacterium MMS25-I14]
MMSIDNNIWQLAEAYVSGTLSVQERSALEHRLQSDSQFAADFRECTGMLTSLENSGKEVSFRKMLKDIHQNQGTEQPRTETRTIPLRTHYLRTAGIAAGIALLTSVSSVWIFRSSDRSHKTEITQLSNLHNELENIKSNQHKLNQQIDQIKTKPIQTPGNLSGTGFALSNDGVLVTNYHVVKEADSLYIQTKDGQYHKASVLTFDENSDVAILRVEDEEFRFSKTDVPYTFAASKAGLGARVFTLGYPGDEIVYSEGYISAKNGVSGDSMQYRLELPAAPGQSGGPVMDAQGNVLAIVTSKQTESEGTTYAVSSKAVLQLLHGLPKRVSVDLPKSNKMGRLNREQQIKRLEDYTCIVQVYKK